MESGRLLWRQYPKNTLLVLVLVTKFRQKCLYSSGGGDCVSVWDMETGDLRWQSEDFKYPVRCLAIDVDAKLLYAGGGNRKVTAWELTDEGGAPQRQLWQSVGMGGPGVMIAGRSKLVCSCVDYCDPQDCRVTVRAAETGKLLWQSD